MPKIAIFIFLLELIGPYIDITSYAYDVNSSLLSSAQLFSTSTSSFGNDSINVEGIIQANSGNGILNQSMRAGGLDTGYYLKNLLLISSLLSLIIGTVVGLAQTKIKRLLAYSTISHVGFILLALAINSEQSIEAFIFYIIQYTITNLNTFFVLISLGYIIYYKNNFSSRSFSSSTPSSSSETQPTPFTDIKLISEMKGIFFDHPVLTLSLSICLFSMAGVPPLIGFFSKQFVLYSAIHSGYIFMCIVAILVSVISASYYLQIIRVLHSESVVNDPKITTGDSGLQEITMSQSFVIATLTLSILLFILKPSTILNTVQLLALSIFYY